MSVKIRLARLGAKKRPFYRIVVADSRSPRDGRFKEIVGTYDPNSEPAKIEVKDDKVRAWLNKGAEPTDTVNSLFKQAGFTLEEPKSDAS